MVQALLFGLVGSSALVLGALLGGRWDAPTSVSGVLLAFASGTLIGALSFELFPDAVDVAGLPTAAFGMISGGAAFVAINTYVDSRVAAGAGDPHEVPLPDERAEAVEGAEAPQTEKLATAAAATNGPGLGVALALLAAVTLDGIPENLALGLSLLESEESNGGGGAVLLVAIFASNLPEALVGGIAMRAAGRSKRFVAMVWTVTAVLLTIAVVLGYGAMSGAPVDVIGFALSFAGGAVLASLADTLMPEAFEHGRPFNSFATGLGFFLSFVLAGG